VLKLYALLISKIECIHPQKNNPIKSKKNGRDGRDRFLLFLLLFFFSSSLFLSDFSGSVKQSYKPNDHSLTQSYHARAILWAAKTQKSQVGGVSS
jgi:hypothetical protein